MTLYRTERGVAPIQTNRPEAFSAVHEGLHCGLQVRIWHVAGLLGLAS